MLYDRFKIGSQISPEELTSMALLYATESRINAPLQQKDLIYKPLVLETGGLTLHYTDSYTANPLPVLAQMAEEFAEALAAVRKKDFKDVYKNRLLSWMHFWRKK
jgi:hypothetical protein